jgi:hypothetical protein
MISASLPSAQQTLQVEGFVAVCVEGCEEEQKGANCDKSDSFVPFAM